VSTEVTEIGVIIIVVSDAFDSYPLNFLAFKG
jgi:hypothetical protein